MLIGTVLGFILAHLIMWLMDKYNQAQFKECSIEEIAAIRASQHEAYRKAMTERQSAAINTMLQQGVKVPDDANMVFNGWVPNDSPAVASMTIYEGDSQ